MKAGRWGSSLSLNSLLKYSLIASAFNESEPKVLPSASCKVTPSLFILHWANVLFASCMLLQLSVLLMPSTRALAVASLIVFNLFLMVRLRWLILFLRSLL